LLDDVQEVSGRLIVKGYRRIAAQHSCAPTAKTTDRKILEIYTQVSTAFQKAEQQRGEHIPALYQNHIVLKFLQLYEMTPGHLQQHLQYEVEKYLAGGLRPDYKQELQLFDPDGDDPDVKRLDELATKALLGRTETKIERCRKRAEAGDAESQFTIGIQYEQGQFGYPKDYCEAAKWYRKAAEQGHAGAQLYLGVFMCNVEQDAVEAYKWLTLAKKGNLLDKFAATDLQKKLIALMTPEQVAEGQRLSQEFVPNKSE
jgi:hypothetical protein